MNKKPRLLIVLSSPVYVRNYVNLGVFDNLKDLAEIYYLVDNETYDQFKGSFNNLITKQYVADKTTLSKHRNFNDFIMFQNFDKSLSFPFRDEIRKKLANKKNHTFLGILKFKTLRMLFWIGRIIFLRKLIDKLLCPKIDKGLSELIKGLNPSLILMPSSGASWETNDIPRIAKLYSIKTIFLVDNWDNLSSKTIMQFKPDFLGVWSNQQLEHAVTIQNFRREQVKVIGSSRFSATFLLADKHSTGANENFREYVLFCGTSLEFDETEILNTLAELLIINKLQHSINILYRPHPWGTVTLNKENKYPDIIRLDSQIKKNVDHLGSLNFQPDIYKYINTLQNAKLIVGGLTSVILEASILSKPFLLCAVNQKNYEFDQNEALKRYEHFRGIESLKNVFLCTDKAKLIQNFEKIILNKNLTEIKPSKRALNYFISDCSKNYAISLKEEVRKLI